MSTNIFLADIAAVAPQRHRPTPNRTLLVDGDGLAYTCAGSDECPSGQARANLITKIKQGVAASGSTDVEILLTASGSTKGGRYAVARAKPYQGQRDSSRRPVNWRYLRDILETGGVPYRVTQTRDLEADDLFGIRVSQLGAENVVIHTADKDMRMLPGWHLSWVDNVMHWHDPGMWWSVSEDKLYGHAWFWHQMLHGDTADNIPGLPWYLGDPYKTGPLRGQPRQVRCGPKSTAVQGLLACGGDDTAMHYVLNFYRQCYGDRAVVNLLEQAVLLWMRRNPDLLDVVAPGHPLGALQSVPGWAQAVYEITERVNPPELA